MSLLSFALSRSNYKEKLKLLLDLEQLAHEDELKSRYITIYNYHKLLFSAIVDARHHYMS